MRVHHARLFLDGIEVGATRVCDPSPHAGADEAAEIERHRPIELELSFRPNWVGIWKLQAALADRPPD